MTADTVLLWLNAVATTLLAGVIWVVQLVVYPGFCKVGSDNWVAFHAAHARRTAAVVALPWAAQGLAVAGLLLRRPSALVLVIAVLALATVVVTVAVSVPLHGRLDRAYDDAAAHALVRTNWWRTAAWSGGAACSLLLLARGTG